MSGCQPCAPADGVLIVSVRVLEYLCCLCGRHVAISLFYGDCMKICQDFRPNFGDRKLAVASEQRTISLFLFQQGIFDKKPIPSTPLFIIYLIEEKTERLPF
jgi:hypothetical protein